MSVVDLDIAGPLGVDEEVEYATLGIYEGRILSCGPVVLSIYFRDDEPEFLLLGTGKNVSLRPLRSRDNA